MPNLLFTDKCNRACKYCFAREKIGAAESRELSFQDLQYVADFLDRSGVKVFNVLGGEPTLHSQFVHFITYLLAREFRLTIFSNAMVSERTVRDLVSVMKDSVFGAVRFCCNVNEKQYRSKTEEEMQDRFFSELGRQASLSFNIFSPDFEPDFLLDTIKRYSLVKEIRLGLASPIMDHDNSHVEIADYGLVYGKIAEFSERCLENGVRLNFDCGFTLCGFSDEMIGKMFKNGVQMTFHCNIPLDIGTDLSVWRCFPLSSFHNRKLSDFRTTNEIFEYYDRILAAEKKEGIYEKCRTCQFLEAGRCAGGCMSHYLKPQALAKAGV